MTIYLYSGTPGSGKSLHAASDVRLALSRRQPRPVVGNFPLAADAPVRAPWMYHYVPNASLTPSWLVAFADRYWSDSGRAFAEDHITLVLDEVQLLHNSRRWDKDADRMQWLEFYSQHRKYGYRVIMVAQSAKMVDNQFRMLLETECNHRRLSSVGLPGLLLSLPFGGNVFLHVYSLYQTRERLFGEWHVARRADMAMYDTHARFEAASGPSPSPAAPAAEGGGPPAGAASLTG